MTAQKKRKKGNYNKQTPAAVYAQPMHSRCIAYTLPIHYLYTAYTPVYTPTIHRCIHPLYTGVYTAYTPVYTPPTLVMTLMMKTLPQSLIYVAS